MESCPDSFVIIGGGVIGMEFATLFATLGKPVTVIEMMPSILPGVEKEITDLLLAGLGKKVKVITGAKVTAIEGGGSVTVRYEENGTAQTAQGGACIVSVGRRPMTKDMGLEALGIRMNRGFVEMCIRDRSTSSGFTPRSDRCRGSPTA